MGLRFLKIGFVIKPHGRCGELFVSLNKRFLPKVGDSVIFEKEDSLKGPYEITSIRIHKDNYILSVCGINDISAAELLRNNSIGIKIKKLPKNIYFVNEIIGCNVYDIENRFIGKLSDVWKLENNDIYVISDDVNEILIPSLKRYFKKVDIKKKKIWLSEFAEEILKG